MKRVGFIGIGKMATAIIGSLVNSNFKAEIYGYDWHENNYDFLKKSGVNVCHDLNELVKCCNFIVFAVKPQNMSEVLAKIKPFFKKELVLISLAAGLNEEFFASFLNSKINFIGVMPNTPLLLGKGAVAICRGKNVDSESFEFVKKMFEKSGVVCEIDSSQMNDIIAINGSSPAFIYSFARGFLNFAKSRNIDYEVALKLFCTSLIGSAVMMEKSNKNIDELISDVSSKGGTTVAGLSVFEEFNLTKIVEKTCEKTSRRAFELSSGI